MTVTLTARQRWQKAYSEARYWPNDRPRDEVLRYALWRFFGPAFGRVFSPTFDRHAATAAAAAWYVVAGKTCVAAYQPKGAASLAASYTNLANPGTYDAAPGVAPTWDATNGWTFNGSSQYLTTGWTAGSDTARTIIARFSGATTSGNRCIVGAAGSAAGFDVTAAWFGYSYAMDNGGYYLGPAGTGVTAGVHAAAGLKAYVAGSEVGNISVTAGSVPTVYIGCRNANGSPNYYYAGYVQAVAIYSATLTAGEVATVSAAMAAL